MQIFHRAGRKIRRAYYANKMHTKGWGVILLYHRINAPDIDPLLLCVTPDHFREHLEILRHAYRAVSLQTMGAKIHGNSIEPWSVAITFDDGYADNLLSAAPLLEEFKMQGTVFVTGQTSRGEDFFYDELEDILFRTRVLPDALRFPAYGKEWPLGDWSVLPEVRERTFWDWNIGCRTDPSPRHTAYRELFAWLRGSSPSVRKDVMDNLKRMAGPTAYQPTRPRGMRPEEIIECSHKGILEIGSHTLSHPVLGELDTQQQLAEISAGKRELEKLLKHSVQSFAYPYGSSWDVSHETPALTEQAGFSIACANMEGTVHFGSSLHWLPRFLVRNWSGKEFAERLERFFIPKEVRPPIGK
jgi:peptidoglycan/xylan/chitin deacetylase (PgdA/CDA1 family)